MWFRKKSRREDTRKDGMEIRKWRAGDGRGGKETMDELNRKSGEEIVRMYDNGIIKGLVIADGRIAEVEDEIC